MITVRIIEITGPSPEDINRIDLDRLNGRPGEVRSSASTKDRGASADTNEKWIPADIRGYVERTSGPALRSWVLDFIDAVAQFPGVRLILGGTWSDGQARYLRLLPQGKPAFAYLNPRNGSVSFRLPRGLPNLGLAREIDTDPKYVRINLHSEAHVRDAIRLAREAYDRIVRP
jgi:hypothetical protein